MIGGLEIADYQAAFHFTHQGLVFIYLCCVLPVRIEAG